ncbi:MAG: trypsin-like serine protease [Rhizobiaceae bacterium]
MKTLFDHIDLKNKVKISLLLDRMTVRNVLLSFTVVSITSTSSFSQVLTLRNDGAQIEKSETNPKPIPELSISADPFLQGQSYDFPSGGVVTRGRLMAKVEAADLNVLPYLLVGRLSVGGSGCTAQFVHSSTTLLTAAHCVYDIRNRQWLKGFEFMLATNREYFGNSDLECISIPSKYAEIPGNEYSLERFKYDYAWIKLRRSGPGHLELKFNLEGTGGQGSNEYGDFKAVGYPTNYGDHRIMQTVNGTLGSLSKPHGLASMVGNLMRSGSSGGAWISDDNSAIGLNSFTNSERPGVMYSPYFDDLFSIVLDSAKNNCR